MCESRVLGLFMWMGVVAEAERLYHTYATTHITPRFSRLEVNNSLSPSLPVCVRHGVCVCARSGVCVCARSGVCVCLCVCARSGVCVCLCVFVCVCTLWCHRCTRRLQERITTETTLVTQPPSLALSSLGPFTCKVGRASPIHSPQYLFPSPGINVTV